jgi:hypothetical protein
MLNNLKNAIADQWNRTSAIVGNNLENWNTKGSKVGIVDEFGRSYVDPSTEDTYRTVIGGVNPTFGVKNTPISLNANSEPRFGDRPTAYIARYPGRSAAIAGGAYVVDQMLNKPVEGIIDLATFNTLNLRPDEDRRGMDTPVPVAGTVPPLSAEDASREIDRLQRDIASKMITLRQLQSMQNEGAVR